MDRKAIHHQGQCTARSKNRVRPVSDRDAPLQKTVHESLVRTPHLAKKNKYKIVDFGLVLLI